jgi:hypothetical protein
MKKLMLKWPKKKLKAMKKKKEKSKRNQDQNSIWLSSSMNLIWQILQLRFQKKCKMM